MNSKILNYILLGFLAVMIVAYVLPSNVMGIAQKASKFTDVEVTRELQTADLTVTDDVAITDDVTIGGELNALEGYTESTATTNTLTAAMSGETFYLSGATSTYILPATSSASGAAYKFVVDGAMTVNQTIVTNGGSNVIEGALIVAGAVVDCDAEDTITFVADGENIGDFVELRSDGDYWFIGASGALTSAKMTCSTST